MPLVKLEELFLCVVDVTKDGVSLLCNVDMHGSKFTPLLCTQ